MGDNMNFKNKFIYIIIFLLLIIISLFLVLSNNNRGNNVTKKEIKSASKFSVSDSLVLYFSVTNNTKHVAEYIKDITDSDIIEIEPVDEYTNADINYSNKDSRTSKEQNDDKARPKVKNSLSLDKYDTIYLGYPIWWGDVPKIILTIFDNYNLEGKTIIPFCTSGSTDINGSVETLRNYNDKLNILNGKRFSSSSTKDDIKEWLDSLNL